MAVRGRGKGLRWRGGMKRWENGIDKEGVWIVREEDTWEFCLRETNVISQRLFSPNENMLFRHVPPQPQHSSSSTFPSSSPAMSPHSQIASIAPLSLGFANANPQSNSSSMLSRPCRWRPRPQGLADKALPSEIFCVPGICCFDGGGEGMSRFAKERVARRNVFYSK